MKSINDYHKKRLGETINQLFTYDWVFSNWWEKLIIAASVIFSGISLVGLLF